MESDAPAAVGLRVRQSPARRRRLRRKASFRVLLLGGTDDARQIAYGLSKDDRVIATASVSKVGPKPIPLGIPTRIGGWGGRDAFRRWLLEQNIDGIIDATHPFADKMSHRAAEVADDVGIEHLQVLRPSWQPEEGDAWTFLNSEAEAADHIPQGRRVLATTGAKGLALYDNLRGRDLWVRIHDPKPGPFPLDHGTYLPSLPGYSVDSETALFERLGVNWLVCRNSGVSGSRAKLDAARLLGIKVAMVRRPPQPEGARAETVSEVLAWARRRM